MAVDSTNTVPMPPADSGEPEPDRAQLRRTEVDEMVRRCLDPAMGLCLRGLDPGNDDPDRREQARALVMRALADSARHGVGADDTTVRRAMARLAELGMDALVGHPGAAVVPEEVDLDALLPDDISAEAVAPGGRLSFAVLQDAAAAARAADRRAAFVALAAAVPPGDAASLLGVDPEALHASLRRIGRRIAEGHSATPLDPTAVAG